MADRLTLDNTVQLLFNDASKTISDLKSREWSATALAVAGIIGLDSLGHKASGVSAMKPNPWLILFMGLVAIAHALVIWRCSTNLSKFRGRMVTIVKERLDEKAHDLFPKKDVEDAIVADEGTIVAVALGSVWLAFLFATLDICGKL